MESNGYEFRGENSNPGHLYFRKHTDGLRSHHIYIFQEGHPFIPKHLNFRDFLRTHPENAQYFNWLKEELADKFGHNSVYYNEGKTDFVNWINKLTEEWRRAGSP